MKNGEAEWIAGMGSEHRASDIAATRTNHGCCVLTFRKFSGRHG